MSKKNIEDQISQLEDQESDSEPQNDFRRYQKKIVNQEKVEQKQDTINICLSMDQKIQFNPNVQYIPQQESIHHKYKIIQKIEQYFYCEAIAFNNSDSIMISTINKDIIVWNFDNGKLYYTSNILKGHQQNVYCLVYSKLSQWFVSGGFDKNIIIWKQLNDKQWISTCICNSESEVFYFYLNKKEDQLFSTHLDGSIKIWLINDGLNHLSLHQNLRKHNREISQISLNEDEYQMLSCSIDKKIIVWELDNNKKWQFQYIVNKTVDDSGQKIIYLDKDTFVWLQTTKGIIHQFRQENNIFVQKKEQQINLKSIEFADYMNTFPFIFNKKKQLLIGKHYNYIYFFKYEDRQLQYIEEPIQCENFSFSGNLIQDGKFLVTWTSNIGLYRVYQLDED